VKDTKRKFYNKLDIDKAINECERISLEKNKDHFIFIFSDFCFIDTIEYFNEFPSSEILYDTINKRKTKEILNDIRGFLNKMEFKEMSNLKLGEKILEASYLSNISKGFIIRIKNNLWTYLSYENSKGDYIRNYKIFWNFDQIKNIFLNNCKDVIFKRKLKIEEITNKN
jgi:hypothetical protein